MTEIIVREAEPKDAQKLINFLNQVGKESHFLTLDEVGILMTATQMSEYLAQIAEKDVQIKKQQELMEKALTDQKQFFTDLQEQLKTTDNKGFFGRLFGKK